MTLALVVCSTGSLAHDDDSACIFSSQSLPSPLSWCAAGRRLINPSARPPARFAVRPHPIPSQQ